MCAVILAEGGNPEERRQPPWGIYASTGELGYIGEGDGKSTRAQALDSPRSQSYRLRQYDWFRRE